ncbi:MAG TPA: type II secretion system F family protein [Clostridia bacterium]|nr:type II secretion system F family protein [Clostridiaceae bacterium]HOF27284.1 type II secretion system F family protein [Clostridia bacterium]HOM34877.1 type II secretion system F family protein [Clostridia bacterium]HOR90191.1 type II secretion system F family protein [Clostridia bacterium]HOT70454.1 type II secretion system F family protein [Clostridia bacterium]
MIFFAIYILLILFTLLYSRKVRFDFPLCHCTFMKATYKAFVPLAKVVTRFTASDNRLDLLYPKTAKEDLHITDICLKMNIFVIMLFLPATAIACKASAVVTAISVLLCFASVKCVDFDISKVYEKKKQEIITDFSVFLTKLTLCLGAGMTLYQAFTRQDYDLPDRTFKVHLDRLINNLTMHSDPEYSFLELSLMLPIPQINAFCSIMITGFKNTEAGIKDTLKTYTSSIWTERRNNAKKRAEQSSAKAVLALAIGLIGILLVLTAPAMIMLMSI